MQAEQLKQEAKILMDLVERKTCTLADNIMEISSAEYGDSAQFSLEKRELFRNYPQFIGPSCMLKEPGDFYAFDDTGIPLIILRKHDGSLGAYLNICSHRGAPLGEGMGQAKKQRMLSCPYHAWTYDLDGKLIGVPFGKDGFTEMDKGSRCLQAVDVQEKDGMMFVMPNPELSFDIDEALGGIGSQVSGFGFDDHHLLGIKRVETAISWKLNMDTFHEFYHFEALHPETIAFPSSFLLILLLKILYPVVWAINLVSNGLVRLLGFASVHDDSAQHLTPEELRTVVYESSERMPRRRHGMLLNILDLEKVSVDEIMVPKNDIIGVDIEDDLKDVLEQISSAHHTRIPVYKHNIDNLIGILHMRSTGKFLKMETLNKAAILQETTEVYYIPDTTPLHTQLFNFQKKKLRMAVVVDEFGAVKGMVTLEDILEEIVGEFTTDLTTNNKDIHAQDDGSYLIDGTANIREINRTLNWDLDASGAKTLNGLMMEILESIPDSLVGIKLDGYYAEIVQVKDNVIRTVRMRAIGSIEEDVLKSG